MNKNYLSPHAMVLKALLFMSDWELRLNALILA
jgi:hypothetical protein